MNSVKSRRQKKKTKKIGKEKILHFLIFTVIYVIFVMWISGMGQHYFPQPIHVGFGQYLDLQVGIYLIGLGLYFPLAMLIYKKSKEK
ncbi:MAG: hypothetical protein ACTSRP_17255 [Candidatus Helarchaeota archaeon]